MVLVTGGTGLVGSRLLLDLVSANTPVKALYRTESKKDYVAKIFEYYSNNAQMLFDKIIWVKGDILTIPSLESAFKDITHVYHAAALISFDPNDFELLKKVNVEGTANIVNMALSCHVKKLCYVSTIGTIGTNFSGKMVDEKTEWTDVHANVYARSKYDAEMEVWRAFYEGLPVVIVNPGVILGAGFWKSGSGKFFDTANKEYSYCPPGRTGFVAVTDVCAIMIQLMNAVCTGERFILVAKNISYKEILTLISTAINKKSPKKVLRIWQLRILTIVDSLTSLFTNSQRKITKNTVYGLQNPKTYDASKIEKELNYTFEEVATTVKFCAEQFRKEHS